MNVDSAVARRRRRTKLMVLDFTRGEGGEASNDASMIAHLRKVFVEARERAASDACGVVLLCESVDILCPSRQRNENSASVGRRVALMLTLLDGFRDDKASEGYVLVIGTTRDANGIDEALRRPGRLDLEIPIPPPSPNDRAEILALCCRRAGLSFEVPELKEFALRKCAGYVGADIKALVREASTSVLLGGKHAPTTRAALENAVSRIGRPSLLRGKYSVVPPPTKWSDIGGLGDVKLRIQQAVEWPVLYPSVFRRMGLRPSRGLLLFGPPGCSKTTLVRAAASASGATLLCLNGADVYSPFVGESEAILRRAFARARASLPAILFLDEIDTLVGRRDGGGGGDGGDRVQQRIVTTLLTEMDGVDSADGLVVIGATNRPDMIDDALRRPGRFDRMLYVPPPESAEQCLEILRIHTRDNDDETLREIATLASKFELTGAEIRGVCQRAALAALRENIDARRPERRHFSRGDTLRAPPKRNGRPREVPEICVVRGAETPRPTSGQVSEGNACVVHAGKRTRKIVAIVLLVGGYKNSKHK